MVESIGMKQVRGKVKFLLIVPVDGKGRPIFMKKKLILTMTERKVFATKTSMTTEKNMAFLQNRALAPIIIDSLIEKYSRQANLEW